MTRVLLTVSLYRWFAAMVATAPLSVVAATPVRFHPRGDAAVFEPGGLWLLETGRHVGPAMGGVIASGGLLTVVLMLAWSLPLGALVAAGQGLHGGQAWAASARRWPTMMLFQGLGMLVTTLLLLGFGLLAAPAKVHRFDQLLRPALVMALAFVLVWLFSVVLDAARTRRFTDQDGALAALYEGGTMMVRHRRLWWAAIWRTGLAFVVTFGAVILVHSMAGVGAPATALMLVHAVSVLAYVGLRASWFACLAKAARFDAKTGVGPS